MKKITLSIVLLMLSLGTFAQVDIKKLYDQAGMAEEMQLWDDAIMLYKKIIVYAPDSPAAYYRLGEAYASKGQDVENSENAIKFFRKYQELDPQGAEMNNVQTIINRLEFISMKSEQYDAKIEALQGRWVTTDWRTNADHRSWAIINIREAGGKLRITIDPTSAVYDESFISQTAVVNLPGDKCKFAFGADKRYNPSSAGYDAQRILLDMVGSSIGGTSGNLVSGFGSVAVTAVQENDVASASLTTYLFTMDTEPSTNGTLKCQVDINGSHTSIKGDKKTSDILFVEFEKVSEEFANMPLLDRKKVFQYYKDKKTYEEYGNIVKMCPDTDALMCYRSGKRWYYAAGIVCGVGAGFVLGSGIAGLASSGNDVIDIWLPFMGVGAAVAVVGGVMFPIAKSIGRRGIDIYNNAANALHSKTISELGIASTSNGVGLVYRF